MPRDANGVYSLPDGYLAVTGAPIQASQHNPPLEDLASAATGSLPRAGTAPMTGPLRVPDGTVEAPTLAFANDPSAGFYQSNGKIFVTKPFMGVRFIGELIPYSGFRSPPPLCVWPYGQTLSRAAHPELWAFAQLEIAAGSTFYNNGDGSTTFGIGDMRGSAPIGRSNMGGVDRGNMPSGGVAGRYLGAATVTLTPTQIPVITPTGSVGTVTYQKPVVQFEGTFTPNASGGSAIKGITDQATVAPGPSLTMNSFGGGASHDNVPPSVVVDFVLFTGALIA